MTQIRLQQKSTTMLSSMSSKQRSIIAAAMVIALWVMYVLLGESSAISSINAGTKSTWPNQCEISFGKYNGHKYQSPKQTIGEGKCLVESKWMQIMQHTVKLTEDKDDVIVDWLFINYHDRVNVLVQDPDSTNNDPKFLVFQQTKYALEGRQSLAVVGGIIEPFENEEEAAVREVREEMGIVCKEFHKLGRFRTDVNRGMGWVNGFLAKDCTKARNGIKVNTDLADEVGMPDSERQDLISIKLADLRRRAMSGEFVEVQWSNTVALALLHLENLSQKLDH